MTTDLQVDKMGKNSEQDGTSWNKWLKGRKHVKQVSQTHCWYWNNACLPTIADGSLQMVFFRVMVFFGIICHAADQGALKIMGVAR